jgi:NAD(P)-dependent dehydrogenase (short-subunit alcohol dehydrogenase family)
MTAIDTQVKEVEKMFAVNVFGPMRMVHFFHPLLIEAKGKIVNIGSVGGIVPYVYGCKSNLARRNGITSMSDVVKSKLQCEQGSSSSLGQYSSSRDGVF